MSLRIAKILLLGCITLYYALVVFNNLTDFDSNYQFVRHVLSMDTTFPGNHGLWRALTEPAVYFVFYWAIIVWELATTFVLGWGLVRMSRTIQGTRAEFARAKNFAVYGLLMGLMLWFLAFITVGGEWFLMWQSHVWNGEDTAGRNALISSVILLFIAQPDAELES